MGRKYRKFILGVLCACIMMFATMSVQAASFTPRMSEPSKSSAYYYSNNPFQASGYGMWTKSGSKQGNCTAYAWGRAYELLGSKPKLSTGNAGAWWNYNKNHGYYSYGSTPKLGAIACWDKYDGNQGHVAVVEAINGNNITISESHWKSTFFDTRTIRADSSNYLTSMRFLGYIYIGNFQVEDVCNCSTSYAGNYIVTTSSLPLTMRSGHGTNFSAITSIPKGATVYVSKANGTWAHVQYNGYSGYCSMQYLTKVQDIQLRIQGWFSKTAMGDNMGSGNTGDSLYLCYKIYDANSGKLWNELESKEYSVKETIYNPDGSEAFSYTYNNDNNWIRITPGSGGTYRGKVEVSGAATGSVECSVNIVERRAVISQWFSTDSTGNTEVTEVKKGQSVYYWYRMYDANTDTDFNDYTDRNYEVTEKIYAPDGGVIASAVGNGIDRNGLHFVASQSGTYRGEVTLTFEGGGTGTYNEELRVKNTYTITYSANGGSGQPSSQEKVEGETLKLSSQKPTKSYWISYNGNGGTVGSTGKRIYCSFRNWNTSPSGTGQSYLAGGSYTKNAGATLYAQWSNPLAGTLPEPEREGYEFEGWYTQKEGGSRVTSGSTISGNMTLYAHWKENELEVSLKSSAGSVEKGGKITLTASAGGGSGSYTYSFLVNNKDTGEWSRLNSFESSSKRSWTALSTGKRVFYVEVKDSKGTVVRSSGVEVQVSNPLSVSLKSSAGSVKKGGQITLSASASGGSGSYTYSFLVNNKDTGEWSRLNSFESSSKRSWTALSTGKRVFYVEVKDSKGTVVRSSGVEVQVSNPLSVSLKSSAGSVKKGGQITLSASASGGSGSYTYSFLVNNKDTGEWSRLNSFESSSKRSWTALSTGKRVFYVEVKDSKGTVVRSSGVEVQVSNPLSVSLKSSAGSVKKGGQITLSASAGGGSGSYTYSFLVNNKDTGEWSRLNSFESSSKRSWTALSTGKRVFYVEVKDSKGTVVRSSGVEVQVSNPLSVSLKSSAGSVKKGGQITLTASAGGGSGSYTYSFLVNNKDTGEWSRLNSFESSSKRSWTAPSTGKRVFYAEVKDSKGTVVRSSGVEVQVSNPLSVSLKSSAGSVKKGGQITLTASAGGGSGSYTYSFLVNNKDTGEWSRLNSFESSSKRSWTAPSTGKRVFYAEVKDSKGTVVRSSGVEVQVSNPLSVSLKSSAGSVKKGGQITLTASAGGGSGSYTYSFLVNNKDTGEWSRLNSFESSSKRSWTAPSTGKRVFYVEVKDSKGTVVRSSGVEVQVSNPLSVSLKSSAGSVKKGGQITLTASASGGSGSYTYSFLVNNKDTGEWSRLNSFESSSKKNWTAFSEGRRIFYVEIKDSKGTIIRSKGVDVSVY